MLSARFDTASAEGDLTAVDQCEVGILGDGGGHLGDRHLVCSVDHEGRRIHDIVQEEQEVGAGRLIRVGTAGAGWRNSVSPAATTMPPTMSFHVSNEWNPSCGAGLSGASQLSMGTARAWWKAGTCLPA